MFKKIIEKIYKNNELLKIGNEESLSSDINFVANNSLDIDDINNNNNKKGRNCCCCCCF